jgi:two-component system phosphate regulon response regulator PhoB
MTRVLLVEDEPGIAELVALHLRHAGFECQHATNATEAQQMINARLPDLVLLDWMLPDFSGLQLARRWRDDPRTRQLPIILLTARSEEPDKVAGLDAGADDYITKPFSGQELLARIRALLRRQAPQSTEKVMEAAGLTLDPGTHRVTFAGTELKLGPTEFKLLHYLMAHPERVHSRRRLLDQVWGDHVFIEERTVDVHVKRLRNAVGAAENLIETVRGAGYRFTTQPESGLRAEIQKS